MGSRILTTAGVTGVLLFCAASSPLAQEREPPPGEGIFCALAIYSYVDQVAAACRPTEAPELRAALRESVARLKTYVLANGGGTEAEVEQFLRDQGGVGAAKERLCTGDPLMMYEAIKRSGPAQLRSGIGTMVARPGKPTWGTCL